MAFGGAGPTHAVELAEELDIPRVLVPRYPGITCALGLALADVSHDYVQTLLADVATVDLETLTRRYRELEDQGHRGLEGDGVPKDRHAMRRSADMRYLGQGYHLEVPVPGGAIDRRALDGMCEAFHAAHEATYGFRNPGEPIELVNIRVTATGRMDKPPFQATRESGKDAGTARTGSRDAYSREKAKSESYALYDRAKLQAGNEIAGPAIVEQPDSTTVIPAGYRARVDGHLNLLIARA